MEYNLEIIQKNILSIEFIQKVLVPIELNRANVIFTTGTGEDSSFIWGNIEGNITDQIDLKDQLDLKADKSDTYNKSEVNLLIPDISNLASKNEIPVLDSYALRSEIPDITNLATKEEIPSLTNYALKSDIPDITGLATKAEIPVLDNYALRNEIPDISGLSTKSETNTALAGKADLVDGKIPAAQLPSYVDDVLEATSVASFPLTGESGKIYVDTTTNITYRWTGSIYTEISKSLALGETSSSAYRGDRGKTAYDHSQIVTGNPHNTKASDIVNIPSGTVTSLTVQNAINELDNKKVDRVAGKVLSTNDFTTEEKEKLSQIETGAQANINPDWNAESGFAQILNKPNLSDISLKKLTGTVTSAAYFKFAETPVNVSEYFAHFRITVSSPTTTIGQTLEVWVNSSGENAPLFWIISNQKSTTAATTGLYYLKAIYPKTLNNGYNAQFELYAYNTTQRDIEIELISSRNVNLTSSLLAESYNSTYQSASGVIAIPYDGFITNSTGYFSVSGSAGSTALLSGSGSYTSGEALVANDLIFLGSDLKWYKVTSASKTIPLGTIISSCGTTYAINATVSTNYLQGFRTLPTGTSGTKNTAKDLYIRGTLSGTSLITDGYLTTEFEAGYSYIRIGSLITATLLSMDGNNRVISIGSNGQISALDGQLFNASTINGLTVETAVPSGAIFTDTIYIHPSTHSADMIVDGTTNKAFTSTEKSKLAGISAGADVSVNADWNATSGKAQILNKPNLDATIPTTKGGTGLTAIGTAGQYLAVNSAATGLEWTSSRDKGVNTVTTLTSLPITKRLITASITSNTTISLASNLDVGDELHIIVYNNSASSITQTLPNSGSFISLSGDTIAVPSGTRIEINILCYASNLYLIRAL